MKCKVLVDRAVFQREGGKSKADGGGKLVACKVGAEIEVGDRTAEVLVQRGLVSIVASAPVLVSDNAEPVTKPRRARFGRPKAASVTAEKEGGNG